MIVPAREPEPQPRRVLNGLSDVRAFFHNNTVPLYFISPTPFNLLGIYRWIRNFFYLTYYDSFEGEHSRVFVPRRRDRRDFDGMGDVCNHLLRDPETLEFIKNRGPGGKACFVMLDEETQALARQAGLEVMHPPAELRHRLESKIVMTRLADEAGVPSVPHVIGRVSSYDELSALAHGAGLGDDLVVEAAYGNAGSATFFVRGLRDWDQCAGGIVGQPEIKVMKRIRNVEVCIEATVTRHGTVIGPAMTSLVGYPELTPYRGAWCGNDVWRGALPPAQTRAAREMVAKLGDVLSREGYRGYFEVDLLHDLDADELYLGEVNPRLSGASPMTNLTTEAYADMPLFLFHLLEYMDVDYELDIEAINSRWERGYGEDEVWGQLIMSETSPDLELFTATPRTGMWRLNHDGRVSFARQGNDWATMLDESEAFYMRVAAPGDLRCEGAQLGVLAPAAPADRRLPAHRARPALDRRPQGAVRLDAADARRPDRLAARRTGVTALRPVSHWTTGCRRRIRIGHSSTSKTSCRPRSRGGTEPVVTLPADNAPIADIGLTSTDGIATTVGAVMAATATDGWAVAHRGALVAEQYLDGLGPRTRHLLFSVSKSLVAAVVGALHGAGAIELDAPVTAYVPALADCGYAGATVRHLLDMRSGVAFSENYDDPAAEIHVREQVIGWAPKRGPDLPATAARLPADLRRKSAHGGPFEYRSCETDVLGWICEAAAGQPMPELMSELLWSRIGAQCDATIALDVAGAAGTGIFDGGISACLTDMIRFGSLYLRDGVSLAGQQVVPAAWIADTFDGGPDSRQAFAASPDDNPMPGGMYRNQVWFPYPGSNVALCVGMCGQLIYVNRAAEVVAAKLSTQPHSHEPHMLDTLRAFDAVAHELSGIRSSSTNDPQRPSPPAQEASPG
ncbi:biotin carboxylase-like protein [Mycobacterium tuberculosis CAS/NITR204]|uniref:Biotin carboxylase-like protein n=3 Tax=Mycobacterium tuberculosis TaxID=1773 RepID=R4M8K8_MYCTX|nr:biotin carboxylase-like protein [Mycobacterium tuberculosis CAS/NITR204]